MDLAVRCLISSDREGHICCNLFGQHSLVGSSISLSDSGDDELVNRNHGFPFSIVLEEVTPIVEVIERTSAAASGTFGHLGFLEESVGVFMYRLRWESGRLRLPINSAFWTTRTSGAHQDWLPNRLQADHLQIPTGSALQITWTSCARYCKLTSHFHHRAGSGSVPGVSSPPHRRIRSFADLSSPYTHQYPVAAHPAASSTDQYLPSPQQGVLAAQQCPSPDEPDNGNNSYLYPRTRNVVATSFNFFLTVFTILSTVFIPVHCCDDLVSRCGAPRSRSCAYTHPCGFRGLHGWNGSIHARKTMSELIRELYT